MSIFSFELIQSKEFKKLESSQWNVNRLIMNILILFWLWFHSFRMSVSVFLTYFTINLNQKFRFRNCDSKWSKFRCRIYEFI